jgi:predicted permease
VSAALLLFPDFALILLGIALRRWFEESTDFWAGLERLIYYVLFPALLFMANARARIDFAAAAPMLASGVAATVAGMALAWLARPMFQPPAPTFAGGFQCAFRFNSYLGLALIGQLHGDAGLARMSLMLGIAIPLVNVVAIWSLARRTGNIGRELVRNPLIIGTMSGIAFSMAGLDLPASGWEILRRLGSATLPLALLAVGAALRLESGHGRRGLIAWWTTVKLVAIPAVAWLAGAWFQLDPVSLHCVVLFAALPPATSAYILAVRMQADAAISAVIISVGTVAAMATLPVWLMLIGATAR